MKKKWEIGIELYSKSLSYSINKKPNRQCEKQNVRRREAKLSTVLDISLWFIDSGITPLNKKKLIMIIAVRYKIKVIQKSIRSRQHKSPYTEKKNWIKRGDIEWKFSHSLSVLLINKLKIQIQVESILSVAYQCYYVY